MEHIIHVWNHQPVFHIWNKLIFYFRGCWCSDEIFLTPSGRTLQLTPNATHQLRPKKTHLVTVKIHLWHQADSRGHNQHNESQISNKTLITIHIDIHRYMMLYDVIWISTKMHIWLWYWHYLLEIWPTMTHNTHHLLLGINRLWGDKGLRCRRPSSPRHLHGYRM